MVTPVIPRVIAKFSPLLLTVLVSGCVSFAKGVTEAVLSGQGKEEDTRKCYIRGRSLEGLEAKLKRQEQLAQASKSDHPVLKVLVVHGIGSHQPGYSTRLTENLVQALSLNHVQETIKEITITHPKYPNQELGLLRLTRYINANESREIIFAELTWDSIIAKEKQTISFDNSGEYSFRRAPFNNIMKVFVNDTIPDVMMFNSTSRQKIHVSVGQSLCWLMSESWASLKTKTAQFCDGTAPTSLDQLDDEFVFITHSLGSRITVDALQWIASILSDITKFKAALAEDLQNPQSTTATPLQTNTTSSFLKKNTTYNKRNLRFLCFPTNCPSCKWDSPNRKLLVELPISVA
ncbi:hypothetical protein [Nitrosomonas sp. Is37]|uniref:hypothetical protein n=1 Tax=Nitrosomonas sp. Is37 TaxID=3080535 RepID=UPI00294B33B1|nr:hypothetical protein [Nitrosomonas sp. Is37]MDV6342956.1 hypothetical protein [Nitrosomonas sp. Is37]